MEKQHYQSFPKIAVALTKQKCLSRLGRILYNAERCPAISEKSSASSPEMAFESPGNYIWFAGCLTGMHSIPFS